MKRVWINLISFCLFWLFLYSCTNEKEIGKNEGEKTEIEFNLNLLGNAATTKAGEGLGSCMSRDSLILLAHSGNLTLNATIDGVIYPLKIKYVNNNFVSEPVILTSGTHSITQTSVITSGNNVLFSGVLKNSPYATYTPELLPKSINIGSEAYPLYKKTSADLYLVCAVNEKPNAFGFIKWNLHFTKVYCIPFTINKCDAAGNDYVAGGSINIKNGTYTNGVFKPVNTSDSSFKGWAKVDSTTIFPKTNTEPASFCFADNYDIDNQNEYYQITLNITTPEGIAETITGYANVNTLLNYKNSNAWDAKMNILHLNFCDCKTWFFSCGSCLLSQTIMFDNNNLTTNQNYKDILIYNRQIGYNTTIPANEPGASLKINDTIRFAKPFKIIKEANNSTYVVLHNNRQKYPKDTILNNTIYHVNLYKTKYSGTPIANAACNTAMYQEMSNDIKVKTVTLPVNLSTPTTGSCESGQCYYLEIIIQKTPITKIDKIEINQGVYPNQITVPVSGN